MRTASAGWRLPQPGGSTEGSGCSHTRLRPQLPSQQWRLAARQGHVYETKRRQPVQLTPEPRKHHKLRREEPLKGPKLKAPAPASGPAPAGGPTRCLQPPLQQPAAVHRRLPL